MHCGSQQLLNQKLVNSKKGSSNIYHNLAWLGDSVHKLEENVLAHKSLEIEVSFDFEPYDSAKGPDAVSL